jgi:hypothetical protein
MEQGIREFDTLRLKFKFYSFYDLNPKTDAVRINMIFEQAKWQLLAEEIDCTEEEMLMFAALQVFKGLLRTISNLFSNISLFHFKSMIFNLMDTKGERFYRDSRYFFHLYNRELCRSLILILVIYLCSVEGRTPTRCITHVNSYVLKPIASVFPRNAVVMRNATKKRCDRLASTHKMCLVYLVHLLALSTKTSRRERENLESMSSAACLSQVQVNLQASVPQPTYDSNGATSPAEDDIDAALTDLQVTLEGSNISNGPSDITQVPELCDELRFFKPKRFTLKAFKRYWFTCRDLQLRLYKSREEAGGSESPVYVINLRGCEVTPDVHLSQSRYGIRLEVPSAEGMTEMWIRCDNVSRSIHIDIIIKLFILFIS